MWRIATVGAECAAGVLNLFECQHGAVHVQRALRIWCGFEFRSHRNMERDTTAFFQAPSPLKNYSVFRD